MERKRDREKYAEFNSFCFARTPSTWEIDLTS